MGHPGGSSLSGTYGISMVSREYLCHQWEVHGDCHTIDNDDGSDLLQ
jgi:hypothetical protein